MSESFSRQFLAQAIEVIRSVDSNTIEALAVGLAEIRENSGRLFILGVGGSAGHASHAVNDFRKICEIEAYSPSDNVSELTARVNDDGWDSSYAEWLKRSNLRSTDALLIFSVGGGDRERNISMNLVHSVDLARRVGAKVFGIVGRQGGYTKLYADTCVVIPPLFAEHCTPHTEGLSAVIWHALVSHPKLKAQQTKWESTEKLT